jgi:hypothetical protein
MSECLIYQLKPGKTMVSLVSLHEKKQTLPLVQVGSLDSTKLASIRLSGESILDEHCYFDNTEGKVLLCAMPGSTTVRYLLPFQNHPKRSSTVLEREATATEYGTLVFCGDPHQAGQTCHLVS